MSLVTGDNVAVFNTALGNSAVFQYVGAGSAFPSATDTTDWAPVTVWVENGGEFTTGENINAANGATVTAEDCTIVCDDIQGADDQRATDSGRYEFTNMNWHLNNPGGNRNSKIEWIFDNVTIYKSGNASSVIGNWDTNSGTDVARWEINGLNVFGDLNTTDATLTTINIFPLRLDTGSFVNGLNLWNGKLITDPEVRGGGLATGNIVYSGLVTGPFGSVYPFSSSANVRGIFRMAVGAGTHTDTGWLLSHDFRSVHGADSGTSDGFKFVADFGGRPFWINPLVGEPTEAIRCGQAYGNASSQNGHFRTVIASLPETTSGDIKFVNAATTTTMYTLPNTFTPASVLTEQATDIVTHVGGTGAADNGLAFLIQDIQTGSFSAAADAPLWTVPTARTYRTYSWQQADWGTARSVTPIASGADDTVRDAARLDGSYPEVNSDGLVNGLDINESADVITAGFATQALAVAGLTGSGKAENARDVLASLKSAHYSGLTTTHVNLPYSDTGTERTISNNVTLSGTATVAPLLTGDRIIPCSTLGLDTAGTVTGLIAPNFTIVGDVLAGDTPKATLRAENGSVTITDSGVLRNATVRADSIAGATPAKLANVTEANGGNRNTYIADDATITVNFTGLTTGNSYTPDELLGINHTVTGGTVTFASDVAINVETLAGGDYVAGNNVTFVLAAATVDFSGLIAAESNFFSATPTTARAYWALTSDYDGTSDQIVTGELTNGVYTIPGLTAGQEVAVAVSKPGRTNFRQVFTYAGGEVITPVLNSIDAVNESTDITGVTVNGGREAGGLIIFGLSGAPTSNSLDGPETVWMTELMKGKARYCVGLLEGLNMTIQHTSEVSSAWDETVFRLEPITTNQQVLGISSLTVGNPNPVQDNGTLSIFINGSTEVNYGTIDNLLDDNLTPITGELTAITNHVNEVEGNQTIITTNQSVILTSVQRGAIKAAAYSGGSITPATDNS